MMISMSDRSDNTQPVGLWWLVFSITLGSLIIGLFLPAFLIVAGLSTIAIPLLAARDLHQSHSMQRELAKHQERAESEQSRAVLLRRYFDAADIPIIATDPQGVLVRCNERASKVLGFGDQIIGRRFDELFMQRGVQELEQLARDNEPGHARASILIRGEMRDFDVSADPVPISGGAILTFRDITELSQAVTLKADFAANASHELRTPIASIKGAAETLMGPAKNDEPMATRLIDMIASNAERLELLTGDLLDLSKLEAEDLHVEVAEIDLSELVESVFAGFSSQADRRDLRLVTQIDESLVVRSDSSLLKLMLRNLVGNAIKFAHEGTGVKVIAQTGTVPVDRTIGVPESLDVDDGGLVLRVVDKGVGIPIEHQQRVFERFYQVDEARSGTAAKRGTGLGLAIVKHAARRLGGAVTLESAYQQGTSITIELPRCVKKKEDESETEPGVETSE